MFVRDGVTDVICTPHIRASQIAAGADKSLELRQAAYETLAPHVPSEIKLHLGFEIMLDEPMHEESLSDRRYSLAGSSYYLVEFLPSVAVDIASRVLENIAAHAIPLVAHPERYKGLSVRTAGRWHDLGARLAVDATTLAQRSVRGKKAREIVSVGLGDLVTSDNHGTVQTMATAVKFLESRRCHDVIDDLTRVNPLAILEDGSMKRVSGVDLGGGFVDGVMAFLKG